MKITFPSPQKISDIARDLGIPHDSGRELNVVAAASLVKAEKNDLAFARSGTNASRLRACQAGVCLITPEQLDILPPHCVPLVTSHPESDFYACLEAHHEQIDTLPERISKACEPGYIDARARLGRNILLGEGVVIDADVIIEDGVSIGHFSIIGKGVTLGKQCRIGNHVCINHANIEENVFVDDGTRIGSIGFGFFISRSGTPVRRPHLGRVRIMSDVEIGPNTVIYRGSLDDTVIGHGSKIDGHVTISHNVTIGEHCMIVSQSGIAGSSTLGDRCQIAGQVGIADHVTIGSDCIVLAKSGVISHIEPGTKVIGYPAREVRIFWRAMAKLFSTK